MKLISNFFKKLSDSIYRYFFFLALVIVSLPLNIQVNAYAIGLFTLNALFSFKKGEIEKDKSTVILYALHILFFIFNLVSVFYSSDTQLALTKVGTKLSFLLIPISFYLGLNKLGKTQVTYLKQTFIVGVIIAIGICYIDAISLTIVSQDFKNFLYSNLSNPLMHRGYLSIFIGLGTIILWQDETGVFKSKKLILFLFTLTLILLQGRMNILAILIVILLYYFVEIVKRKSKKLLIYISLAIVGFIVLFKLIPPKYNRFNQPLTFDYDLAPNDNKSFTGITIRLAIWEHVIPLIKEKPLFGHGTGDTGKILSRKYYKSGFTKGIDIGFNCHNQYFETTAAAGIFATLVLLSIFVVYVKKGLKHKNEFTLMASGFFFLSMITESVLERHWGITMFVIILPLLYKKPLHQEGVS